MAPSLQLPAMTKALAVVAILLFFAGIGVSATPPVPLSLSSISASGSGPPSYRRFFGVSFVESFFMDDIAFAFGCPVRMLGRCLDVLNRHFFLNMMPKELAFLTPRIKLTLLQRQRMFSRETKWATLRIVVWAKAVRKNK